MAEKEDFKLTSEVYNVIQCALTLRALELHLGSKKSQRSFKKERIP
jgi:hypothetical protein